MTLYQPPRGAGYRANVDAVLLAWFAGRSRVAKYALDLGAGVGSVGLSLLYRERCGRAVFAEIDPALADLCRRNLAANAWEERGEVLCIDLADASSLDAGTFDLVVSNPPYVAVGRGRPPRVHPGSRVGDLSVFTRAARRAVGPRGRACFIYPAHELGSLIETLRASGLEPKELRFVHASADELARVVLVEAVPGKRGGLKVSPPFVERAGASPSRELSEMLGPTSGSRGLV